MIPDLERQKLEGMCQWGEHEEKLVLKLQIYSNN